MQGDQTVKIDHRTYRPDRTWLAITCLVVCLIGVAFVWGRPRLLGRGSDAFDLTMIPVAVLAAFHAARYTRVRLPFLLYGCVAGMTYMFVHLSDRGVNPMTWWDSPADERILTFECCLIVVGMMLTCLYAAVLRFKLDGRRRHPPGHCQACGYNLTGNVSGVCPECGEKVRPQVGPASGKRASVRKPASRTRPGIL
jgi:hypothetical protein